MSWRSNGGKKEGEVNQIKNSEKYIRRWCLYWGPWQMNFWHVTNGDSDAAGVVTEGVHVVSRSSNNDCFQGSQLCLYVFSDQNEKIWLFQIVRCSCVSFPKREGARNGQTGSNKWQTLMISSTVCFKRNWTIISIISQANNWY